MQYTGGYTVYIVSRHVIYAYIHFVKTTSWVSYMISQNGYSELNFVKSNFSQYRHKSTYCEKVKV